MPDPAVRFRQYLENVKLNNVMNGLVRSDALRKTCLNIPFHSSDKCLIAELALYGKFIEIAEPLLFRHMDVKTSTALKGEQERRKFFAVEPSSPSVMWHWKAEKTLLKGVWKSRIGLRRKAVVIDLRFTPPRVATARTRAGAARGAQFSVAIEPVTNRTRRRYFASSMRSSHASRQYE